MPLRDDAAALHYAALHDVAVTGAIAERRQIAVAGPDRAAFLQGFFTNDIEALSAGRGCYAAWLTPQGRMLADLHVLESGDMMLLDVPAAGVDALAARLEQFHFVENVQIESLAAALGAVWVHGPAAADLLDRLASPHAAGGPPSFAGWGDYQNARIDIAGVPAVVARIDQLGVPGYAVYVDVSQTAAVTRALADAGAVPATADALDAARIESGYPVFGLDMTDDTIPLEAGIEGRAISLTKGCYVGQEVIIRVLHRGHGRVARKLVPLGIDDGAVPARGSVILSGDRPVGAITSSGRSPRHGVIALGYVQRDLTPPGTDVDIDAGGARLHARVRAPGFA